MKADTLTVKALFQKDVRYVIPPFQRPYVWQQDDQWEPLWEDVRVAAERLLDEIAAGMESNTAEERVGRHFLGALVVQQRSTGANEVENREVIDGQQRMTTIQLLLDAAQAVTAARGHDKLAQRLSKLVLNDELYTENADERFKVWPTSLDQPAFRAAMDDATPTGDHEDSLIVAAHDYFRLQIDEWLSDGGDERAVALVTTLMGLLEMVVIDLEPSDDPHTIFETLNARGTPLLQSDLVKNYLLHEAGAAGASVQEAWATFETAWWRAEQRQGRLTRPRLDVFLDYWLIARMQAEVSPERVFRQFRDWIDDGDRDIFEVAEDLATTGAVFESWEAFPPLSWLGTFFYRWRTLDVGVTTPLLLYLFSEVEDPESPDLLAALAALESYLVRRMVCRMTPKGYNNLFLEMVRQLDDRGSASVDEVVIGFLGAQEADARLWPTDGAVKSAFRENRLYPLLTRSRLRMVLEAIEDHLRGPKTESEHVVRGSLTIEHLMPQTWHTHWPLNDDPDDPGAPAEQRDRVGVPSGGVGRRGSTCRVGHRCEPRRVLAGIT